MRKVINATIISLAGLMLPLAVLANEGCRLKLNGRDMPQKLCGFMLNFVLPT